MKDFEYYAPHSLQEAVVLLDKFRQSARVIAGGTDLIVQMKNGRVAPSVLIDAKKIPELNRLEWKDGEHLFIGAAVPLSKVIAYTPIKQHFGILYQSCSVIGSMQLRNRGTIGGNICNAAPSADSAPPLLCLGAKAVIAKTSGTRKLPLQSFFSGPGETALSNNEILIGIEIPAPPPYSSGYYLRHTPRQDMDIAVAGVAALLIFNSRDNVCREARIALAAVAPTPIRVFQAEELLKGKVFNDKIIVSAAEQAAEAARPISDMRGSAAYRQELVKVLATRTLKMALEAHLARN